MIVLILILINVVVFLMPFVINFGGDSFLNFISLGWKSNPDIIDGEYYRLLSSNFLHGGLIHLLFNMYSLFNIGPIVISMYGSNSLLFLITYISSGLTGSLFSFYFNPSTPSLGASGAIMGLLGTYFAASIVSRNPAMLQSAILNLVIIFALGLSDRRIDNFGHLGGLICGFVLFFVYYYLRLIPA